MLTEKDLLKDIIQYAPEYSVWNISSDSWGKIPEVFAEFLTINDVYGWDVVVNKSNREQIAKIIDREEIYDKVVHQDISFDSNIIFQSYDHMAGSWIKSSFPNFELLMEKYRFCEAELLELINN